ncbi:type VII secretion integral membrane protein EccD [Mycobacteroides abscessus subsp. bolletii]|uniref:Type VII secretion integral membrane protein EccD n=1 Tax=Mycobacteroides abscessus subsp. bolletii TaxID=319705 RepID=A0A9Q7SAK8_9MYCO|nr:type VII secretion integral membrane protein EccD [Mycobacteroides abscessus]SHT84725.1 type VII secretion integral membrane protein EccD [Mycobacteroides abscessus subsp. bolletii]SHU10261.1 type VII secretion integral membrane protein EccD [Mycobacteroides abscessus subsp. bolletii]SHW86444.1 type VII secretion integral membrane protein EccD [Mycobacteroides abscessus subsp. bolletii]SIC69052.1 type VII secretion integral membrane protein EccD [Mycobacteroides abscessus subsp. abscessus]S
MTSPTSVLSDTTYIAVNVHARNSAFEMKLHAHTPVVSLLPPLRKQLSGLLEDGPAKEYLAAERVEWALEYGPARERLDPESTLDEKGVLPGEDLYLTHRTRTESYPVLRDDLADGTAEVSKRMFAVLDRNDTRRLGAVALPFAVSAVAGVGIAAVFSGDTGARWAVLGALVALALMCATLASVLTRTKTSYGDVAGALCIGAYLSTAAAALVGVPRELGIWHLTTVGAGVATMAVVLWSVTGNKPPSLHVGVTAVSVSAVFIALLHALLPVSSQAVAAQMVFVCLGVILWCTQISRLVGRVQVNYIPTTGEPLIKRKEQSVAQVSRRSTSAAAIESMLNQEVRVIQTLNALVGLVCAASLVMVLSAFAGGYYTRNYEWHMFVLVATAAVASVAVGRGLVIRAASIPLTICGPLAWTAYLAGRALSESRADNVVLLAGIGPLVIGILLSAIWAIQARTMHSPLSKRRLEIVATVAVITVFPLLVFIMEGWPRVRNR